jgi:L-lactate dehydrogenase
MKVAIIGTGAVGETCAHALVTSGLASEFVLLNRTRESAVVVERDLRQARAWHGNLITEQGDAADLEQVIGCELAVLTVGPRLWGDQTRPKVAPRSAELLTECGIVAKMKDLAFELPPILVVTNPVEPIVTWLWRKTGIVPTKLFGLGATVDSARFSLHVGSRFDVSAASAWTTLAGEHGDGLIPAGPAALAGIVPTSVLERAEKGAMALAKKDARMIRELTEGVATDRAKKLAGEIETILGVKLDSEKRGKLEARLAPGLAPPATRFAIAAAVTEVARAVHTGERRIMAVSSAPPPDWELPEVALALPFRVGRGGAEECLLRTAPEGLAPIAQEIDRLAGTLP